MGAISFKVMFVDACFLSFQLYLTYGVPPKDRRQATQQKLRALINLLFSTENLKKFIDAPVKTIS